jgi:hypothetical protein
MTTLQLPLRPQPLVKARARAVEHDIAEFVASHGVIRGRTRKARMSGVAAANSRGGRQRGRREAARSPEPSTAVCGDPQLKGAPTPRAPASTSLWGVGRNGGGLQSNGQPAFADAQASGGVAPIPAFRDLVQTNRSGP